MAICNHQVDSLFFTCCLTSALLTLTVLNFWKLTSYCSFKPLWSGKGEVVPARTLPTLHPPSPPTVHKLSRLALSELICKQRKEYMYGHSDTECPYWYQMPLNSTPKHHKHYTWQSVIYHVIVSSAATNHALCWCYYYLLTHPLQKVPAKTSWRHLVIFANSLLCENRSEKTVNDRPLGRVRITFCSA